MTRFIENSKKEKLLADRMNKLGIAENDISEEFVRSSGKGGQNVNKVSTCVILKHLPTGLIVKCSAERSQILNRYKARLILTEKIEDIQLKEKSARRREIEKIRRQKRKRSKRAKEKILLDKKMASEKKKLRKKVSIN